MSAMTGHVVSIISESGVVKNVGIVPGTTSPALSVQELFPLPVFVATVLSSRNQPMSDNVGRWHVRVWHSPKMWG